MKGKLIMLLHYQVKLQAEKKQLNDDPSTGLLTSLLYEV